MTDQLDADIRFALNSLVPPIPPGTSDWERVVRDATSLLDRRPARRVRRVRLLAPLTAVVAAVVAVPVLAASQDWWFFANGAAHAQKNVAVVASGNSPSPWKVQAFGASDGRGLCLALSYAQSNGAGGCGFDVRGLSPNGTHEIGYVYSKSTEMNFIFGVANATVTQVRIELASGNRLEQATIPAPQDLGTTARLYVLQVPVDDAVRAIVALSADGAISETRAVGP